MEPLLWRSRHRGVFFLDGLAQPVGIKLRAVRNVPGHGPMPPLWRDVLLRWGRAARCGSCRPHTTRAVRPDPFKPHDRAAAHGCVRAGLEIEARGSGDQVLDGVGRRINSGPFDHVLLSNAPWFGAGSAGPDLSAIGHKRLHDLSERLEAFVMDWIGIALRGQPYPINRQE